MSAIGPLPPGERSEPRAGRVGVGVAHANSGLRLERAPPPRPSPLSASRGGREQQDVARDFEALFIAQLLKAARSAQLADDPLSPDDNAFRDAQDRDLAQRLATAAPLGVAKLLR